MTNSMRALLVGAALTGFVAGTSPKVMAQDTGSKPAAQGDQADQGKKAEKSKKEKHACKGQNSCKGKGGCKTSDNGCKGKNSCKGKGGCNTKGSCAPKEKAPDAK
jgi:hypothetical protein